MRQAALVLLFASVATAGWAFGAEKAEAAKAQARTRLVRSWPEPMTVSGKQTMGRVEYVFDYDAGVFTRSVRDDAGRVLEAKTYAPGEIDVAPSKEEIAEAMELVRSDPEFSRILEKTGSQLMGGFVLNEKAGQPCGPGTRCLHVQLNTADGWGIVRWAVVDLTKRAFAYRSYRPEMSQQVGQ
jgi:hypothetical protein